MRNEVHITAPSTPTKYDVDVLYEKIYTSLKELIKQSIKTNFADKDNFCPFGSNVLYKNQTKILQEISPYLMKEKKGDQEVDLPIVLLIEGEVKISNNISIEVDKNEENEFFIDELKEKCAKRLWNNPTYRLTDIKDNKLILGESNYYKTLYICVIYITIT